jgi:uncharacterized protein YbaR (Trm112 family)
MRPGTHEPMLVCPQCASRFSAEQRFCPDCKLPLVLEESQAPSRSGAQGAAGAAVSERHERARKIKPQLAEGEPVKVAWASNQSEGEFIQGLLLEEGVPSMLRRSAGFDVPDFLAAGPRDVLVPMSGADAAREILLGAEIVVDGPAQRPVRPGRLLAGLLVALLIGAAVVWVVGLLIH